MWSGLSTLGQALTNAFTDPGSRTFWLGLVSMAIVAVLHHRSISGQWAGGIAWILPKRLLLHRSTALDLQLLFARQLLRGLGLLPVIGGSWWMATHLVRQLDAWFGSPEPLLSPLTASLAYTATLFVAWDASRYLVHRALHGLPFLWQFHQVHHSAEVLTPLTFHRTHPVETVLFEVRGMVVSGLVSGLFFYLFRGAASDITLAGVHAIGLLCNVATGNLRHSHIWLRFGMLERWLISPAQHQLHHSGHPSHVHCNYGTWIAFWDRLGGTWIPSPSAAPATFGLGALPRNHRDDLISAWFGPLIHLGRSVAQSPARLAGLFALLTLGLVHSAPAHGAEPTDPADAPQNETDPDHTEPDDSDNEIIVYSDEGVPLVAGSAHVVTEESLERFEHNDIHSVLAEVPGVYVRGEEGFGLRPNIGIRGTNSDRSAKISLLEDGVPLAPAPYAAPAAYYFPMSTRMVGIEVYKGAAAIQYGPNTVGGAINLLTRPIPLRPESAIDISVGLRQTGKVHAWTGRSGRRWGILAEGIALHTDGFKQLDGGGFTGFDRVEFMLKAHRLSDPNQPTRHNLELKLGYGHEHSAETYLGLAIDDYESTPYRRYAATALAQMRWHRTQAEATWKLTLGDRWAVHTVAYHHYLTRSWTKFAGFANGLDVHGLMQEPVSGQSAVFLDILRGDEDSVTEEQALQIGTNLRHFHSFGVQSRVNWTLQTQRVDNTLELGVRLHGDHVQRLHTEDSHWMQSGSLVATETPTDTTLDSIAQAHALAAHAHNELAVGAFRVLPGVRLEAVRTSYRDREETDHKFLLRATVLPGLGTHLKATPWLDLFAGAHRGFSPVAPGQPADVRPELSWNYEAGVRVHKGIRIDAVGFLNDYSNLTGQCTFSGGCQGDDVDRQYNGGKVLIYGAEASVAHRLLLPADLIVPLQLTYTWTHSEFVTGFVSDFPQFGTVETGDRLPYVPNHRASAQLSLEHTHFQLAFGASFRSGMLDAAGAQGPVPDDSGIPPLVLLDTALSVPIGPKFLLYINASNVLGSTAITSWRAFGARPTAPRQIQIGLKMKHPSRL